MAITLPWRRRWTRRETLARYLDTAASVAITVRHLHVGAGTRYGSRVSDPFPAWFESLEARHRQNLTFAEIRKGLQALSSLYVERRDKLGTGSALDGAGKRAAFALYYSPLHFLLVREIVRALGAARPRRPVIVDLGCGTGAAGAAWALEGAPPSSLEGVDRNGWAIAEARANARALGLAGRFAQGNLAATRWPAPGSFGILLAFAANELGDEARATLLPRLLDAVRGGSSVLVVEPLARRVTPWWASWASAFAEVGGRTDEWRLRLELPPTLRLLDKAAGLDHRELLARSLHAGGSVAIDGR
jgi:SAM-dependent methyltransferase